jgi:hypothetical protein
MSHARKTACITTGGYFPPHSQYESMELREEPEDTTPTPPPSPDQASEPDMPQEELEPKEEVVYLSDDENAEFAQGGEQPPSPPQDGSAEVGVPSFSMGWTTRIHHKSSYDTTLTAFEAPLPT